jgi:hypothetical protein
MKRREFITLLGDGIHKRTSVSAPQLIQHGLAEPGG